MSQDAKQRTSIATQRKRLTAGEYIDSEQCRGKKGPADREGRRGDRIDAKSRALRWNLRGLGLP